MIEPTGGDALLVPLTLVVGPEELLVAREVRRIVAAARARDAEADIRELAGDAVELGLMLDLATPSMFGGDRVVVIRDSQELAEDVREALVGYVAAPAPDVVLVIAHSGVVKGKRLPGRMGGVNLTIKNLEVVGVDPEQNVLLVRGAVPGPPNGLVIIKKRDD